MAIIRRRNALLRPIQFHRTKLLILSPCTTLCPVWWKLRWNRCGSTEAASTADPTPSTSMTQDCSHPNRRWTWSRSSSAWKSEWDLSPSSSSYQVVVVGLNYRVASLGFLYLGEEGVDGNAGLLDQVHFWHSSDWIEPFWSFLILMILMTILARYIGKRGVGGNASLLDQSRHSNSYVMIPDAHIDAHVAFWNLLRWTRF